MTLLPINNILSIKLRPESKADTIPAPEKSLWEIVAKRRPSQKRYQMPGGKEVAYCWNKQAPVHYKDNYADEKEEWKDIDPTYYEDDGKYLTFNRMPQIVRIDKRKIAYEITDKQTGKIMSAELLEVDDTPVTQLRFVQDVTFEIDVQDKGVRLWKETGENGPTKFRWKIAEADSRLKFREAPEAFDTEKNQVPVHVKKEPTKDGFIWTEEVDRSGVKIDTDFTGETSDGHIYGTDGTYSTARSTATGSSNTIHWPYIGQIYDTVEYNVYRTFLDFDTSSISASEGVEQVNLKMTVYYDQSVSDFDVQIIKQTWTESIGGGDDESNYDGCLSGTEDDSIWRNTSGISTDTAYTSGDLDTSRVNKSGDTKYSLRSSRDKNNTTPTGGELIRVYSADDLTAAYRPVLVVSVSTPQTLTGVASESTSPATAGTIGIGKALSGTASEATAPATAGTATGTNSWALTGVASEATAPATAGTVTSDKALTGVVSEATAPATAGGVGIGKVTTGVASESTSPATAGTVGLGKALTGIASQSSAPATAGDTVIDKVLSGVASESTSPATAGTVSATTTEILTGVASQSSSPATAGSLIVSLSFTGVASESTAPAVPGYMQLVMTGVASESVAVSYAGVVVIEITARGPPSEAASPATAGSCDIDAICSGVSSASSSPSTAGSGAAHTGMGALINISTRRLTPTRTVTVSRKAYTTTRSVDTHTTTSATQVLATTVETQTMTTTRGVYSYSTTRTVHSYSTTRTTRETSTTVNT